MLKSTNKNHKIAKTKDYIKKNNLLFILFFSHSNVNNLLNLKQNLKILKFKIMSSFRNIVKKALKYSIYLKFKALKSHTLILISFKHPLFNFFSNLNLLSLNLLAIKLNGKIYHRNQFKNNYSLSYTCSKFLLFKFNSINLKKNSK